MGVSRTTRLPKPCTWRRKRDFLIEIRQRVYATAVQAQTLREITRKVFHRGDLVDYVSFSDGWLALITGSDFSRAHMIKSFLRTLPKDPDGK
jgi:hypothetical protein